MKNTKKIIKLIENGQLLEAANSILACLDKKNDVSIYNDTIQIKSTINRITKENGKNSIYSQDYAVEINRCTVALLSIVTSIKEESNDQTLGGEKKSLPNIYIGNKYEKFKQNLIQFLDSFEKLIDMYNETYTQITEKYSRDVSYFNWLTEDKNLLLTESFTLLTIGEPNVGKSCLNNLFMGVDLLGVDEFTETAALTIIKNSDSTEKSATINFFGKSLITELKDELETSEDFREKHYYKEMITKIEKSKTLKKYLGSPTKKVILTEDIQGSSDELRKYSSARDKDSLYYVVEHIEVNYPTKLSQKNIILVDAPGLNDLNPLRSRKTKEYLEYTNAIAYCVSPHKLVTENLHKNLHYLIFNQLAEKLIIIINKIDLIEKSSIGNHLTELNNNLEEVKNMILLEAASHNDFNNYLKPYIHKIFSSIPIFTISALKANEAVNKNLKNSPYFKNYKKLINYIDDIQYSGEFYELRIQKFITKYAKKINEFEEKIKNSIKVKENEREEDIRTKLQALKLFIQQYEERSKSAFNDFEKNLKKNLALELETLIIESKANTLQQANFLVDECPLEGVMSNRKIKMKELIDCKIQPLIKTDINVFSTKLNENFNKNIKKQVEILKRNLEVITMGIESDFFDSSLANTDVSIPSMFDLREITNIVLNSLAVLTGLAAIIVAPAIIAALIPGAIISGILGMLAMWTGLGIASLFSNPIDAAREKMTKTLKGKIKNNLDINIPKIYDNIASDIKIDSIILNIRRKIYEEFESKIAQKLEPYEIAMSNYDSDEIATKFTPILEFIATLRININALNLVFVSKSTGSVD